MEVRTRCAVLKCPCIVPIRWGCRFQQNLLLEVSLVVNLYKSFVISQILPTLTQNSIVMTVKNQPEGLEWMSKQELVFKSAIQVLLKAGIQVYFFFILTIMECLIKWIAYGWNRKTSGINKQGKISHFCFLLSTFMCLFILNIFI